REALAGQAGADVPGRLDALDAARQALDARAASAAPLLTDPPTGVDEEALAAADALLALFEAFERYTAVIITEEGRLDLPVPIEVLITEATVEQTTAITTSALPDRPLT